MHRHPKQRSNPEFKADQDQKQAGHKEAKSGKTKPNSNGALRNSTCAELPLQGPQGCGPANAHATRGLAVRAQPNSSKFKQYQGGCICEQSTIQLPLLLVHTSRVVRSMAVVGAALAHSGLQSQPLWHCAHPAQPMPTHTSKQKHYKSTPTVHHTYTTMSSSDLGLPFWFNVSVLP